MPGKDEGAGKIVAPSINSQHLAYFKGVKYGPLSDPSDDIKYNDVGLPIVIKENPSKTDSVTKTPEVAYGVPSFINPYALLAFPTVGAKFNQIIDDPSSSQKFSSPFAKVAGENPTDISSSGNIEPTVYNLVNTPPDGSANAWVSKMPYRYTDFLYSKFYGKIPNNHLITLRRYPAPTYDNLAIPLQADEAGAYKAHSTGQGNFKPIAQAITYLGEEPENKMSDLIGFEVSMAWKKHESNVENVYGNEQDADGAGNSTLSGAAKFLTVTSGLFGGNVSSPTQEQNSRYDPYANGPYSHRVYGPVNVIASTFKRDRGLDFKQSFSLNFHYELKSIGSINPKAAMLDIMSNMLQLTYNNAAFWGGANRYFGNKPVFPFLGGRDGMNAWYRGEPTQFLNAVGSQIKKVANEISGFFTDLMSDPVSALKQLATNGISTVMKVMGRGRAPDIVAMKALLTGEPVGEWHLVVGNPYSPTLMVGNLICTGAKFQFNDTLGADNFPTELKVTIQMEHGRPRDKGDIESMFNAGEGRIYYAPMGKDNLFKSSAEQNSTNDTTGGKSGIGQQIEVSRDNAYVSARRSRMSQNQNALKNSPGTQEFDKLVGSLGSIIETGHDLAMKMGLMSAGESKLK
jgi:hypothetical protein